MRFRQFYLGCLSHASYYLGSEGEAVVIDPQRDVEQYVDEAAKHGQTIKYVIETHSHADFVSGHIELATKTGAQIVYGQRANTQFPTLKVKDRDLLKVGAIRLTFRETPGHTPEGITIIATDGDGPPKVFTGDTLFIGDVGRPDLVGSKGFTSEEMASMLFDSLREKILSLPDDAEIYPAHGAGSMCGKNLSKETWSTLGEQRKTNYALQPMPREEFVRLATSDLTAVPIYFPMSAEKNLAGPTALETLEKPREFASAEIDKFEGIVVDVRNPEEFGSGHVPNSMNIGLGGQFASWAGALIPIGTPLAIVATGQDQIDESVTRLGRVGHDTCRGFVLIGDYDGDQKAVAQLSVVEANEFLSSGRNVQFLDVRRLSEYTSGHAVAAEHRTLDGIADNLAGLDPAAPTYVICQGGYRSSIATSILERAGFSELYNVTGGTAGWLKAELPTES
ncbi:MAG: MBL fold metallo-hydrolase [Blastocatellia bacterium]|nr:MBL fold metallo-hydrolase [Blastocatellia bacterium]